MCALRACFDTSEPARDGGVDGLVVAQLEMQAGVVLDTAPVAAKKHLTPDEVERPGNRSSATQCQHQQNVVAHLFLHKVEEFAGQVGAAPFARAGVLIELPERIPMLGPQIVARQRHDVPAKGLRLRTFLADRLALARGQAGQEVLEAGIAAIFPVKLLRYAVQKAHFGPRLGLCLGAEGDVQGRQAVALGQLDRPPDQGGAPDPVPARTGQQAPARCRCEGHGHLELGVIAPAGLLIGMGPVVIEDVLALAVALGIERCDGNHLAACAGH